MIKLKMNKHLIYFNISNCINTTCNYVKKITYDIFYFFWLKARVFKFFILLKF